MVSSGFLLLGLGVLGTKASALTARAVIDGSFWKDCTTTVPAQVTSYESCYTSIYGAVESSCRSGSDACACELVTSLAKTCIPIVCPTSLVPNLLASGCEAIIGTATTTTTASGGRSGKGTNMTTTAMFGSGSTFTAPVRTTTSGASGVSNASGPQPTATDGSSGSGQGSGSGSGSGSGNGNGNGNGPAGATSPPRTTSSTALAGDLAAPVVGGALAGIAGALAFLL